MPALSRLTESLRRLGVRGTAVLLSERLGLPLGRTGHCYALTARGVSHSLACRVGTSDAKVFKQVFLDRQYACINRSQDVELIVDCGANVGYSAAFFLSRYPKAELVAVEPDRENLEMLKRNTQRYDERIRILHSAVWSHSAELVIAAESHGEGQEWGRQVREADTGHEHGLTAVTIGELLEGSGHSRISILKMDIEGAEAVVFSEGYDTWLPRVDNLLIELHPDTPFGRAPEIFHRAIEDEPFVVSHSGELTVCSRTSR